MCVTMLEGKQADNRKSDEWEVLTVRVCVCACESDYSESLLGGNPDVRTRLLLDDLLHLCVNVL